MSNRSLAPVHAPLNATMDAYEWSLLIALSVLWGGSFFFVAVAVRELPPFTVVLARVTAPRPAPGSAPSPAQGVRPRRPR